MSVTSVQINRDTSKLLDDAAKASGLRKGALADMAIRFFFDPHKNPGIIDALLSLNGIQEKTIEQVFAERIGSSNHE